MCYDRVTVVVRGETLSFPEMRNVFFISVKPGTDTGGWVEKNPQELPLSANSMGLGAQCYSVMVQQGFKANSQLLILLQSEQEMTVELKCMHPKVKF